MSHKIPSTLFILLGGLWFGASALADEADSTSAISLVSSAMEEHPEACLGWEVVPGLNDTIHGEKQIAEAKQNWPAMNKVISEQTDYTLEAKGDDVLLRPKNNPAVHNGPIVQRPVKFRSAPDSWPSITEALRAISFADESLKFEPDVLEMSMTYMADHKVSINQNSIAAANNLLTNAASDKSIKLSDALFLLARMANARCWAYESSEGIIINGQIKTPRKLIYGTISFTGPDR